MSRPRNRDVAGFTLLECEVALIVLGLVIFGLLRATSEHEVLLSTLDELTEPRNVRWVRPADDPLARALGRPAELLEREPAEPAPRLLEDLGELEPGERFEVRDVGRDLGARTSWAVVSVKSKRRDEGHAGDDGDDDGARGRGPKDASPGKGKTSR